MPQTQPNRKLDVICLGRLGVDIYAQQIGARLEDVSSFAKYLGGSSANIAFGTARLGLKSSMLTRVGDEHMGRFLRESLQREGCDVSHVKTDPARLTALVILGIKDRDTFPLIFYRENCADMAISEEDFDEAYIASARALVITGTHFSTPSVHKTSMKALEYARKNGVKTVLDIDYRPVLWGLTGRGEGEQRFIQSDAVTAHLQNILPHFDLLVGTEEEINIAGGSQDLMTSLRAIRKVSKAVLVVKLGVKGCAVIEGEIPKTIDDAINIGGFPVEVLNVLGAGDAFMSGFLKGYLTGADWKECGRLGNACGAIVVSRHACSPAMPTPVELEYFFKNYHRLQRPDQDATLARLHRVTVPRQKWDDLVVFAFDHRTQFFDLAQQVGASEKRLFELKELLVKAVEETEKELKLSGRIGILADDRYGQDALNAATGRRWWIGRPVEMPGSNPLEFDHGRAIGSNFISWPQEHIIKCLVQYHPDETVENRIEQETQVLALYQAAQVSGNELLLEVIPSKKLPQKSDTVLRAMKRFYNLGIYPEWWKLESMSAEQWREVDALINERDPYCRGVVILGLNAPLEQLAASFRDAQGSTTVRGFAVGRTIFQEPSKQWLAGKIDSKELVSQVRKNFEALIRAWQSNRKSRTEAA